MLATAWLVVVCQTADLLLQLGGCIMLGLLLWSIVPIVLDRLPCIAF